MSALKKKYLRLNKGVNRLSAHKPLRSLMSHHVSPFHAINLNSPFLGNSLLCAIDFFTLSLLIKNIGNIVNKAKRLCYYFILSTKLYFHLFFIYRPEFVDCVSSSFPIQRERKFRNFLKMKRCELCKSPARIYCESDQANLCWNCDEKVHSANFLVAKHVRCLFCIICQTPTSWSASGDKLGRTISLCDQCIKRCNKKEKGRGETQMEESEGDNDEEFESGSDFSDDDSDENSDDEDDDLTLDEDCDNQVVPWSSNLYSPPPAVSSSDSEVVAEDDIDISLKQSSADLNCQDNLDASLFYQMTSSEMPDGGCIIGGCLRPFKFRKLEANRVASWSGSTITEAASRKASEALYMDLNKFPSTN